MTPGWDPAQYLRFASERTRPAVELAARVPLAEVTEAVDLGCGPGNSTEVLAARWPAARLTGVDSSPEMLAEARAAHPDWAWVEADVAAWAPATAPDLIFSNAALHWLDDHAKLFPRLMSYLAPGGLLAVQMPANYDAPSHTLMREAGAPWADRLPAPRSLAGDAGAYYDWLAPRAASVDLWETTYHHVLDGPEAVVDWVRGTGLRPYLEALEPSDRPAFEARYLELIREAYPHRADGTVLMPFQRLFLVAVRA